MIPALPRGEPKSAAASSWVFWVDYSITLAIRGCTEEPGNTGRGDTEILLNTLLRNTEIT